jgi:hypothetical protein
MKKILVVIALAFISALSVNAQTRVVVRRTPARKVVVVRRPVIRPVVVTPARAVVVRPHVTVVRPVVRRRVVVVH